MTRQSRPFRRLGNAVLVVVFYRSFCPLRCLP